MIKKYRKKPVVVEAIQFRGWNWQDCKQFMSDESLFFPQEIRKEEKIEIETLEGIMTVKEGDYIIKGVLGEFYPCDENIFRMTYEEE